MLLTPSKDLSRFAEVGLYDHDQVKKIIFFEKIAPFYNSEAPYKCRAAPLNSDENTQPLIHGPITGTMSGVNYDHFLYDIDTIEEINMWVLSEGDEIMPHRDVLLHGYRPQDRKITCLVMLSDSSEYEGGTLKIDINGNYQPVEVDLKVGCALYFDSAITWSIDPITSGTMRMLATYAWGKTQL